MVIGNSLFENIYEQLVVDENDYILSKTESAGPVVAHAVCYGGADYMNLALMLAGFNYINLSVHLVVVPSWPNMIRVMRSGISIR